MNKEYEIYTSKIAFELRKQGFPILRTGINPRHPQFDTYIFEDSEAFRKAFEQLTKKQQKGKKQNVK